MKRVLLVSIITEMKPLLVEMPTSFNIEAEVLSDREWVVHRLVRDNLEKAFHVINIFNNTISLMNPGFYLESLKEGEWD